jgi:hypothetical protein
MLVLNDSQEREQPMRSRCFASICLFAAVAMMLQAADRPVIWVHDSNRAAVLEKIETQPWAREIFERMRAEVDPLADRHVNDPAWILSRVQLTWSGPNYTDFRMEGGELVQSGHAAHPTVRFMQGRMPRSPDGNSVEVPDFAEIPPFNPHPTGGMKLLDRTTGKRVMVPYIDRYLRDIQRPMLELAVDSSVLYWLTGDKKYAAFSADILSLFCEALAPMNTNPEDAFNWGLISNNHLLEARWFSNLFPIIYDFVSPYIEHHLIYDPVAKVRRPFNRERAQEVFRKYIHLALDKGILNCNWVVFESSSLVNSALALDDPAERAKYMDYFLYTDTEHQQSMKTFMTFFTEDDFWFESLSYGDETITFLTYLFLIAERQYPELKLLDKYPVLFDAIHVMPRYQFPNGESVRFGDSHRDMPEDPYSYEMMNRLAKLYGNADAQRRAEGALHRLIADGAYDRSAAEPQRYVYTRPLKLLWFEPALDGEAIALEHPRTDTLAHAGLILQRNAEDAESGMMIWQGGAHHVHAHATGMHMELYGKGEVVGAEAGKGSYPSEIHQQYYRVYAAHNNVIVNNASRGQGGWIDIGQDTVQVVSAEPAPRTEAVSPECSFATTSFVNLYGADARQAQQQRTIALIRTTPTTGYYVDVYRSRAAETNQFHDYLYHNLGSKLQLTGDFDLQPAPDWFGSDIGDEYRQPGTRWLEEGLSTGLTTNAVKATFRATLNGSVRTRVWFPAGAEREVVSVTAPPTLEAPSPYDRTDTPVVIARRTGEAWNRPFEAVYQVYRAEEGASVRDVRRLDAPAGLSVLQIEGWTPAGEERQTVFAADREVAGFANDELSFKGRFAVLSEVNGEPEYIYLGDAVSASFKGWAVSFADGKSGAADIRFKNGIPEMNSRKKVTVTKEN